MSLNITKGILNISKNELNLKACLKGGMSFRWKLVKESENETEFIGIIKEKIFTLKQIPLKNMIEYSCFYNTLDLKQEKDSNELISSELHDYFRLNENLAELYAEWSSKDSKFNDKIKTYPDILNGIRVLRLDPVENLFSFICSSNNNIKRITQMVSNMCIHFGKLIGKLNEEEYYSFPTIDRLAESDVEDKLRKLNFGYRAKFIYQAAFYIKSNNLDDKWLYSLRSKQYNEVVQELIKIPGIGKKVADCISLMSMDKLEAIPVDTHVLSIAKNTYNFVENDTKNEKGKTKTKSLTDKSYKHIADNFRNLWGKYAGWAQTIMFIDDLTDFQKAKTSYILNKSLEKKVKEEVDQPVEIKQEDTDIKNVNSSKNKRSISSIKNDLNTKNNKKAKK